MNGLVQEPVGLAVENGRVRRVLYTARHCQLVVTTVPPGEEIGEEIHPLDQYFRVEGGSGLAILEGVRSPIREGSAMLVPAGTRHNIVNTGAARLKLYTLYSPPGLRDGGLPERDAASAVSVRPA